MPTRNYKPGSSKFFYLFYFIKHTGGNFKQEIEMRSINIKTILYHVIVINCGDPDAVPNADISGSEFTYLHNVTYTCHHGYRMTGSPICTCLADGRWSAAPICQRNYILFYNNSE